MSDLHNVIESLNDAQMKMILDKIGLIYEEIGTDVYMVCLSDSDSKFNVVLVNMHDTLLLSAPFNDDISANSISSWNTNYPFAKSYFQQDGSVSLGASHYLRGGVTVLNVVKFLGQFHSELKTFAQVFKIYLPMILFVFFSL